MHVDPIHNPYAPGAKLEHLTNAAVADAIIRPAEEKHVTFDVNAVKKIIRQTQGYPYFLQEWGKHSWDSAIASPITLEDDIAASTIAIAALDESFFVFALTVLHHPKRNIFAPRLTLVPAPPVG